MRRSSVNLCSVAFLASACGGGGSDAGGETSATEIVAPEAGETIENGSVGPAFDVRKAAQYLVETEWVLNTTGIGSDGRIFETKELWGPRTAGTFRGVASHIYQSQEVTNTRGYLPSDVSARFYYKQSDGSLLHHNRFHTPVTTGTHGMPRSTSPLPDMPKIGHSAYGVTMDWYYSANEDALATTQTEVWSLEKSAAERAWSCRWVKTYRVNSNTLIDHKKTCFEITPVGDITGRYKAVTTFIVPGSYRIESTGSLTFQNIAPPPAPPPPPPAPPPPPLAAQIDMSEPFNQSMQCYYGARPLYDTTQARNWQVGFDGEVLSFTNATNTLTLGGSFNGGQTTAVRENIGSRATLSIDLDNQGGRLWLKRDLSGSILSVGHDRIGGAQAHQAAIDCDFQGYRRWAPLPQQTPFYGPVDSVLHWQMAAAQQMICAGGQPGALGTSTLANLTFDTDGSANVRRYFTHQVLINLPAAGTTGSNEGFRSVNPQGAGRAVWHSRVPGFDDVDVKLDSQFNLLRITQTKASGDIYTCTPKPIDPRIADND